ncbi:MAG: hypothetical protein ACE5D2_06725 [Fidelibacterota bacterium]
MNRVSNLIFILCFYSVAAQWSRFDLDTISPSNFKSEVLPIFRQGALTVGFAPLLPAFNDCRLHTGLVFSRGVDLTNSDFARKNLKWIPVAYGSVLITSNLDVRGKIGGLTTGKTLIQLSAFGLGLKQGVTTTKSFWKFDVDIGRLQVVHQYQLTSYEFALKRAFSFHQLPVFLSLGSNQFEVRFNQQTNSAFPARLGSKVNYLKTGAIFNIKRLFLVPQITGNTKFISVLVDLNLVFN